MAGYININTTTALGLGVDRGKLKRKEPDLDHIRDDFSIFSLSSSPATKIRRLDAELPPIFEEEECEIHQQSMPADDHQNYGNNFRRVGGGPVIQELPPAMPENEERAIVLFKPINMPLLQPPSNFRVSVDSGLISGFKNPILWSGQATGWKPEADDEAARKDNNYKEPSNCLAVVPWIPSRSPTPGFEVSQVGVASELMEAEEESEAATMEIEDNNDGMTGGMSVAEDLHHWQQQHCMLPQPPENTSTPVVWYR